jgi:hypothetical protein
MDTNTLTLETVRLMWQEGLDRVNAVRRTNGMPREMYYQRLEGVIADIKMYLKQHGISGLREVLVKHGEGGTIVIVNFDAISVRPDANDPEIPFFSIPATQKAST